MPRSITKSLLWTLIGVFQTSPTQGQSLLDGYLDQRDLVDRLTSLADAHASASLDMIGATPGGNGLFVLTLSDDPNTADERPGILITAGLDARHLVGTETAWRVAQRLASEHRDLLEQYTIYVIPRMNPDAAAMNMQSPYGEQIGTMKPVDDDRDGTADEDGPVDINGDGYITMMRRVDPPLDDPPTHLADPAEPRLLCTPAKDSDQRAIYTVYTEGLDQDGDGLIAEDGAGQTDLDRNFMHRWPEYGEMAGRYPLSEDESLALARFVLAHPNIVASVTYGRHDTLVSPPDGKGKDITGRAPKNIDPGDVGLYKMLSERFKEVTGQNNAPKEDAAGSFHSWLYAQRGIPGGSTVVWGRPKGEKKDDGGKATTDPTDAPAPTNVDPVSGDWSSSFFVEEVGQNVDLTLSIKRNADGSVSGNVVSAMGSVDLTGTSSGNSARLTGVVGDGMSITFDLSFEDDAMSGSVSLPDGQAFDVTGERVGGADEASVEPPSGGTSKDRNDKPADAEAAAWLKYFDETDTPGFIDWQPFDHPTLGPVEIGGFVPLARMNPPADQLDELAKKQTAFIVDLAGRLPALHVEGPEVTRLANNLYEIRLAIVNDGALPARTAMAQTGRTTLPTIVMLSTPVDRIITGTRLARAWKIEGHGGRSSHHWIIRTEPGERVSVTIRDRLLGERIIDIPTNN